MPYFSSPKILYGKGMLKRMALGLQDRGNKAVLITDKAMVKLSDQLVDAVRNGGFEVKL